VSRSYLDTDPLAKMSRFNTTPRTKRRAMTAEEIAQLLAASPPGRRLCFHTAFASGLRAGELRALRARHLDLEEGGLLLEAAWTKNRQAGFQPLPRWLMERLRKAAKGKKPNDPLLVVPSLPARALDEDLKRAGISKHTSEGKLDFHVCRVAFVSWILEAGASAKEAQVLARHASADLTMNVYARARSERLAEVTEAVGRNHRSTTGAQRVEVLAASGADERGSMVAASGFEPGRAPEEADSNARRSVASSDKIRHKSGGA